MARQELKIYTNMMKMKKGDESMTSSRINTKREK